MSMFMNHGVSYLNVVGEECKYAFSLERLSENENKRTIRLIAFRSFITNIKPIFFL